MEPDLPEHVRRNRAAWDTWAPDFASWAPRAWADDELTWGIFSVPEAELGALPESVAGMDVVELGCGTAYISAKLARRGARPVGIDNSPAQLATARRMQEEFGLEFPLHLGNAEQTPFPDASFDLAVSEYGASIWCDPYLWIPEAARILRPGGHLVFLVNGVLLMVCTPEGADAETPATECLERPYFGMHRFDWPDGSVSFNLGHGDWIRVLRTNGFDVEGLIEVQPPEGATTSFPIVTPEWARRWPCEEIWIGTQAHRHAGSRGLRHSSSISSSPANTAPNGRLIPSSSGEVATSSPDATCDVWNASRSSVRISTVRFIGIDDPVLAHTSPGIERPLGQQVVAAIGGAEDFDQEIGRAFQATPRSTPPASRAG